jgi:hypothetical protein
LYQEYSRIDNSSFSSGKYTWLVMIFYYRVIALVRESKKEREQKKKRVENNYMYIVKDMYYGDGTMHRIKMICIAVLLRSILVLCRRQNIWRRLSIDVFYSLLFFSLSSLSFLVLCWDYSSKDNKKVCCFCYCFIFGSYVCRRLIALFIDVIIETYQERGEKKKPLAENISWWATSVLRISFFFFK